MTNLGEVYETYGERLENDACYIELAGAVKPNLESSARTFGLQPIERIAHGVLTFCIDQQGDAVCLPWLIDPQAPPKDITGGRHGLVMQEFYFLAERYDLRSSTQNRGQSYVDFDDFLRTYVVRDDQNQAQYTVICSNLEGPLATAENVGLLQETKS